MAHIDELVRKVSDPLLREALAEQVRTLTDRREFGLVFQKHTPEAIRIPQQRIRRGDTVEFRDEAKGSPRYRVVEAKASEGWAVVVRLDASGEPVGDPEHMLKADLVVVKEFGQPVYPGLKPVGEAGEAKPDQPTHVVINGENYHALQALEYTHAGKVDLIYIDPPYNTGNADWKYSDRYVDGQDAYRHSKWLSFMERRLQIAKRLLKDTGVIVLAIDDNEHARLKLLADQVLGEASFLSNIVWQGGRKNDAQFVSPSLDYMLVYSKSPEKLAESGIRWMETKPGVEDVIEAGRRAWADVTFRDFEGHRVQHPALWEGVVATREDTPSLREAWLAGEVDPSVPWKTNSKRVEWAAAATAILRSWWRSLPQEHPARANAGLRNYDRIDTHGGGRVYRTDNLRKPGPTSTSRYDLIHPVTGMPVVMHPNGWVYSRDVMAHKVAEGRILFGRDHTSTAAYKRYLEETTVQSPMPVFTQDRANSTKHVARILGDKRFPYPKDHEVLMRWFRMMAPQDAVIVDFFAGSGTTAEAVIRLNDEDGGTRQCILATNNELSKAEDAKLRKQGHRPGDDEYEALGVFNHVTKPRLSTVLTGLREDGSKYSDGIPGQRATFFDLTYEDENLVALGRRFEAIAPLLWMQAGARGEMIEKITDWGFDAPAGANYAVIFDAGEASAAIASLHDGIERVFVVTDSDAAFRGVVAALPRRLQGTAQRLYANYLRSFEINRAP